MHKTKTGYKSNTPKEKLHNRSYTKGEVLATPCPGEASTKLKDLLK